MSEFPPGFDYETLITDEDRELRKLALALYSEDAADKIREKYIVAPSDNDPELCASWTEYVRKVRELIARKLPETEFIKKIEQLNLKTPYVLY
ncbi:hypothetical protein HF882_06775 [Victivallis vadensis]|uniref:Uncharacterized protein n=1 Tax=Victivallis vadensis TaxID=172901 RepID=A0A848B052_9BACT|nr:hypothetical protein [Victivallis vadensis]NMD86286.1 hypothetical protein [Victivallis vadensis]